MSEVPKSIIHQIQFWKFRKSSYEAMNKLLFAFAPSRASPIHEELSLSLSLKLLKVKKWFQNNTKAG